MKTKIGHRIAALMLAGLMCSTMIPTAAFAEGTAAEMGAVTLPLIEEVNTTPETAPEGNAEQEEQAGEQDDDPLPAAEPCEDIEHISNAEGVCTICNADLLTAFRDTASMVDEAEYYTCMNALGWYGESEEYTARFR